MGVCTYLASIIEVKNLTKKYRVGSEIISALNGVDLKIESGEFLAIVGTSGSGKSTLLHMMSGLERPTKGEILINGVLINKVREKDMASFRRKHMDLSFNIITFNSLDCSGNAALPLVLQGVNVRERNKRAVEILKTLG